MITVVHALSPAGVWRRTRVPCCRCLSLCNALNQTSSCKCWGGFLANRSPSFPSSDFSESKKAQKEKADGKGRGRLKTAEFGRLSRSSPQPTLNSFPALSHSSHRTLVCFFTLSFPFVGAHRSARRRFRTAQNRHPGAAVGPGGARWGSRCARCVSRANDGTTRQHHSETPFSFYLFGEPR